MCNDFKMFISGSPEKRKFSKQIFNRPGIYIIPCPKNGCNKRNYLSSLALWKEYYCVRQAEEFNLENFNVEDISISSEILRDFHFVIGMTANLTQRMNSHYVEIVGNGESGLPKVRKMINEDKIQREKCVFFPLVSYETANTETLLKKEKEIIEAFERKGASVITGQDKTENIRVLSPFERVEPHEKKFKKRNLVREVYREYPNLQNCSNALRSLDLNQLNKERKYRDTLIVAIKIEKTKKGHQLVLWKIKNIGQEEKEKYIKSIGTRGKYKGKKTTGQMHEGILIGKLFGTIVAKPLLGFCRGRVSRVIRGVLDSAYGYKWVALSI